LLKGASQDFPPFPKVPLERMKEIE